MTRSPFIPAIIAFLFSSLFSFATSAIEGDWERLDGGARLRLQLDAGGRLHGTLTNRRSKPSAAERGLQSGSASQTQPRVTRMTRTLRRWRTLFQSRHDRVGGLVLDSASRRHRLGSARLCGSDRLRFRARGAGQDSEWRRLS